MDIPIEELDELWKFKFGKYTSPSIKKGYFDGNIFWTMEDNRSVLFFVLAGNNQLKKLKTKSEIHKVYVITRSDCEEGYFESGEKIWFMKDSPVPVSCQRPFNELYRLFLEVIGDIEKKGSKRSKSKVSKGKISKKT